MPRAVAEWVGKTPDAKIPPRVRLRVWERCKGTCHLTGRKIMAGDAWDLDHVVALINGGEHRESNLAPALRDKHREKTAEDVANKARRARIAYRHVGITAVKRKIESRGFDKAPPQRTATRPIQKLILPFRRMP